MTQSVGYFEDDVTFTEGPFVICNPLGSGWRIEAEYKGAKCPGHPDTSIYDLRQRIFGWRGKTDSRDKITAVCDHLNRMVAEGKIVLKGNAWVVPQSRI